MDIKRINFLRSELEAERISYGELAEIESAFEQLDPATLRDRPENAMAGDMLDELEDAYVRATETFTKTGVPRKAAARAREHGAKISLVFTGDEIRVDFPNGSGITAWSVWGAKHFEHATKGRVRSRWAGADGQLPPGDTLIVALNNFADGCEQSTVTDADRVAYTLTRLERWAGNFDANAESARVSGGHARALELTTRANDIRDIIKMLDGTEDAHIRSLRNV